MCGDGDDDNVEKTKEPYLDDDFDLSGGPAWNSFNPFAIQWVDVYI